MPLFRPNQPLSARHRRVNRAALALLSLAGITFGVWNAHEAASISSGYVAVYAFAAVFYLGIFMALIGLLLAIYWRTRWFGFGFISAGILSYLSLCGGIAILTK